MEHQFKPWQPVIVRNDDDEEWKPTFYAWQGKNDERHYTLGLGWRRQVLPAKGNRHLIGTTDSPTPPEPEFEFGDKVEVSKDTYTWKPALFIRTKAWGCPYVVLEKESLEVLGFRHCRHANG